jgi:hypothetical protein
MSTNPALSQPSSDADNRRAERHNFTGAQTKLLIDGIHFTLHLKDLSTTGLCGLTDAPLAPGQMVCLLLDRWEPVAAEIKWIRRALVGLVFAEPLPGELIARLKRSHAGKRK